ncbi:MAG: ATP-binding protein [Clostridiales bacterium]|nr:ATP-binding protein [Clostridiales bacterium]
MKLTLRNVGKIKQTEIELNGITVLGGENGTGKSTAGKALYGLLSSFYDANKEIEKQKRLIINNELGKMLNEMSVRDYFILGRPEGFQQRLNTVTEIMDVLKYDSESEDTLLDSLSEVIIANLLNKIDEDLKNNEQDKLIVRSYAAIIASIGNITDEEMYPLFVDKNVGDIFHSQINHINDPTVEAAIKFEGFEKPIELTFIDDKIRDIYYLAQDVPKPIYIDSTFTTEAENRNNSKNIYNFSLSEMLIEVNEALNNELSEVLFNKKIKLTLDFLNGLTSGDILPGENKLLAFQDDKLYRPVKMGNLSLGLKAFAIIKRLLKNRHITENTILIIDEPETHLHPEWQLKFAQLLVFLQKDLNLTIMLATHSPYILNAIEVYSAKHGIADKCKYYLAENDEIGLYANISDVSANTELVYQKLAIPLRTLRIMSYGEDYE